jgi:hypothetical protein
VAFQEQVEAGAKGRVATAHTLQKSVSLNRRGFCQRGFKKNSSRLGLGSLMVYSGAGTSLS